MKFYPTQDAFCQLAEQGNLIPVYAEVTADFETPVSAFARLRSRKPAFLFESIVGGEHISRYSIIGSAPRKVITSWADKTVVTHADGSREEVPTPADPLKLVEAEMEGLKPVRMQDEPLFTGGAVGFIGHEYIHRIEPSVPRAEEDTLGMPLMCYAIVDTVVIFDRVRQTLRIISNARLDDDKSDPQAAYAAATTAIEETFSELRASQAPLDPIPLGEVDEITVPPGNFTQEQFETAVEKAKEYVRAGDVVQIVGSQRFEIPYAEDGLSLYRALRIVNPSPYMFMFETEDFSVIGASPEVHVRSTEGRVEIRPIAGTRPRGATPAEDAELEKDLLADPKERAEHLMLVDLARNDIGRVCEVGTVQVQDYAIIERYSHVMHIVSQVEGQLAGDKTAFDLMRATFPAGTLSGAPKIRAMQIIAELEKQCRGVYGGALGYFSYNGNLDSCIAIRTALLKEKTLFIQSGAGLVADSIPEHEYQETVNKAKGMLKAVALSQQIARITDA
ncbi:anthranilate synthase component I [Ruficoccus sp. ZRK36]|uniref:anthranilate synthase component I n=1 Tax=Ruficoccus sp. ZRK36 TaxID=2866311 RepID=UPI001C72E6AA|nr:anthranilate synthase component I [Ruficoccus sp. ZRK36]QYY36521.1 anthranilate synthase component I [Ruficoccus sp. ZRK36]